ncbi:thiamine pyrophosphate-binding protein [Mesoterricola sediminis]|uniref:Acetolactate synthase n=1 Tax=Mesoterricola sediminis TaxID=2927980 RepID=A0AA48GPM2_9BACT|nr:thiamine pyrophosphate-binding protein [Mesoterricola sediminis]BDU75234.1 acetolactate synthase [Mesoterricola sediminis]
MMKLSDYVARFLDQQGLRDIFLVSGGGIMHLLDSVGRQPGLRYWCTYHEQAAAIAAEGLAKVTNRPGVCLVTVGPGGVNALSGVVGAWFDSTPMLVLSGQVRRNLIADYGKIRQFGPQEADVVGLARHVTKHAVTVMDPARIRWELEHALHVATHGRPGPVWLDLPLDVQGALLDPEALEGFQPPPDDPGAQAALEAQVDQVVAMLQESRRPLLLAGNGIHRAGCETEFLDLVDRTGFPVVLPFSAKDLLWEDHPGNMGVFGAAGQRRANFTLQNADLILSLASGLCVAKAGFATESFAPRARKILVDIDPGQLHDQPIRGELAVQADIGAFLRALLRKLPAGGFRPDPRWGVACRDWKARYPALAPEFLAVEDFVNTYVFMDRLAEAMGPDDVLVTGNGMDIVSHYQAFRVRRGQRTVVTANWGAMGWDLPLAVGACIARDRRRTVLVTGDGSVQLNIQELLTVSHHRLPVKIFIFNNGGYSSIRATQNAFFQGFYVGADATSGVASPDFRALAAAYGMTYRRIPDHRTLATVLAEALAEEGPCLTEVAVDPAQAISPKASAFRREDGTFESRPLEDMAPFLPREEVHRNMHLFDAP